MKKNNRRLKRKGKLFRAILIQLILIIILIVIIKGSYHITRSAVEDLKKYAFNITTSPEATAEPETEVMSFPNEKNVKVSENELSILNKAKKHLYSKNAILVRLEDQKTLLEKNSDTIIYPASMTKIMTAIVAIENLKDLNNSILLSSDLFPSLYDEDASMAGFLPEESVSAIDLLYGVLLPSGAECCLGLANYISGTEDAFVNLMNKKAATLGMKNTHFTNTTGLNDPEHYTTAKDLSLLLEYALQNDTFREIFTSPKHATSSTNLHPNGITVYSTLFKNIVHQDFNGGSILGGKTGYTSKAGLCLASLAQKNGKEYILVTAGADGSHDTEQYNISDALQIYESIH
jgi:D-alanyl-D-alanine carboxypeptidase